MHSNWGGSRLSGHQERRAHAQRLGQPVLATSGGAGSGGGSGILKGLPSKTFEIASGTTPNCTYLTKHTK